MPYSGIWARDCFEIRYTAEQAGDFELHLWYVAPHASHAACITRRMHHTPHASHAAASHAACITHPSTAATRGACTLAHSLVAALAVLIAARHCVR